MLLFFCIVTPGIMQAQQDTVETPQQLQKDKAVKKARDKAIYGDAHKATVMSACLPGLGQIHNKKYWKVPIIYAALGGLAYFGINSQKQYKYYSDNLRIVANDPTNPAANITGYSQDDLVILKNTNKKYRDYAIMGGALIYLLNIVDANVDAHLKTFDVSNDLSLNINPYSNLTYNNKITTGLSFKLTFK